MLPGGYVQIGVACTEGSDATAVDYLGGVVRAGGTIVGRQRVVSHQGSTFDISGTAVDNQSGTSEVLTETVTVLSPRVFHLSGKYGSATYRWCGSGSAL